MLGGVLTVRERLEDVLFIGACVVVGEISMHGDAAKLAHLGMVQDRVRDEVDGVGIQPGLERHAHLICLPSSEAVLRHQLGCGKVFFGCQIVERGLDILNLLVAECVMGVDFARHKLIEG